MPVQVGVAVAGPSDLPALLGFFRAMAEAESPGDPTAGDRGEAGLQASLAGCDILARGTSPLLLARVGGEAAGYLQCAVLPKADARVGYLFVDELYVLPSYRRRGVARALLERVQLLAAGRGLAGVRLLVRGENAAARQLYRALGFAEHPSILCEWKTGQGEGGDKETG
jgi:ribosomal protein S18 acetylase RimI-like enzyme